MSTINMTLAELRLFIEGMPEDTVLSVDLSEVTDRSAFDGESQDVKEGE